VIVSWIRNSGQPKVANLEVAVGVEQQIAAERVHREGCCCEHLRATSAHLPGLPGYTGHVRVPMKSTASGQMEARRCEI